MLGGKGTQIACTPPQTGINVFLYLFVRIFSFAQSPATAHTSHQCSFRLYGILALKYRCASTCSPWSSSIRIKSDIWMLLSHSIWGVRIHCRKAVSMCVGKVSKSFIYMCPMMDGTFQTEWPDVPQLWVHPALNSIILSSNHQSFLVIGNPWRKPQRMIPQFFNQTLFNIDKWHKKLPPLS